MKRNKEKGKLKKGCWWRALLIFLMLLLVAVTALLVNFLNGRNAGDQRFEELLNQEFDSSGFTDNVSRWRGDFVESIRTATGNASVCDDEGEIDFDILMGKDSRLNASWSLDKYDLAIYCSQRNGYGLLNATVVEQLRGLMTINRIDLIITGQVIEYTIVYQIAGSGLSSVYSMTRVPESVYLVANATIDLSQGEPVKMYNYTINQLTGEDNEYCLKRIFGSVGYTEKVLREFAYTPFAYLEELNELWGSRFALTSNSIKLIK